MVAAAAGSQPLTAERAVQIALQKSTSVVNAMAGVVDARGGVYGAYSGVMPQVSASWSRGVSKTTQQTGTQLFGTLAFASPPTDIESYSITPQVTGQWSILNLSNLSSVSAARSGLKASQHGLQAARSDVALETRRRFYNAVSAVHLGGVADAAVKLSRDDERRVRALFEVGSVSRSDLLRAQVRTASSQLDSITAHQAVVSQRVALAEILAMPEGQLGEVDTTLTAEAREFGEAEVLAEASRNRPDLQAAEAELRSAKAGLTAAQLARLPYVSVSGSAQFNPSSNFTQKQFGTFPNDSVDYADASGIVHRFPPSVPFVQDPTRSGSSESDRILRGQIALTWDLFTGFQTESRIAQARARVLRAEESRNALRRGLEGEVYQAMVAYREALGSEQLASTTLESATENLKLTQQKYNVGSTTILELIDSQVSLTRAAATRVQALAAIRIAEAQINRVRGRIE